jgi:hypothetical protein
MASLAELSSHPPKEPVLDAKNKNRLDYPFFNLSR